MTLPLVRAGPPIPQTTNRCRRVLWQLLRNRQLLGFNSERQHQSEITWLNFYCHEGRLVIECDGSVHHKQ